MKTPVSLVVAIGASMLAGSLTVPALAQVSFPSLSVTKPLSAQVILSICLGSTPV